MMPKSLITDKELMVKACKLYYFEDKTQSQISKVLGISRPQVSRLLSLARADGTVKIEINPIAVNNIDDIAHKLQELYKLKNSVVAPENPNNGIISAISSAASAFLSGYLKDGQIVGVSWGRTLFETVEKIVFNKEYKSSTFIPLLGGVGQLRHEYQMNSIVEKIANAFHSNRFYLFAPAFLQDSKTLELMLNDSSIKLVSQLWNSLDLAIVGIGEPISLSNAFKNIYDKSFLSSLINQSAVGDIAARFYNKDGVPCTLQSSNILGVSLEQLKKVPEVIAVAGGKEKIQAIHAAVKAGYVTSLITDRNTALSLIEMEEPQ